MSNAPTEPADALVPQGGTEQAVDQKHDRKPTTEEASTLGIVADVGDVVFDLAAAIFDS